MFHSGDLHEKLELGFPEMRKIDCTQIAGRILLIIFGFVLVACSESNAPANPKKFTAPAQFLVDKETYAAAVVKVERAENRWVILEDGDHFPFLVVDCEMDTPLAGSMWAAGTVQQVTQSDYTNLIFDPISPPAIEGRRYVLWAIPSPKDTEDFPPTPWLAHPQGFLLVRGTGDQQFIFWNGKSYSLNAIRDSLKAGRRLPLDQIADPVDRLKIAEERMKGGEVGDEKAFIQGLLVNLLDPEGQAKKVEPQPADAGSTDMFGMNAGNAQPHAIWYESLAMLRDFGKQASHRKEVVAALAPVARSARPKVRLAVALALVDLDSDAGREALLQGYATDSGAVSSDPPDTMTFPRRYPFDESSVTACSYALARLGDHRGLKNSKPEVRLAAAEALKDSRDPELAQALREMMGNLDAEVQKLDTSGELSKQREEGDYTSRYPENWIRARMLLARTGDNDSLRVLVEAYVNDAKTYPEEERPLVPRGRGVLSSEGPSLAYAIQDSDTQPSRVLDRMRLLFEKDPVWDETTLKTLRASMTNRQDEERPQTPQKPTEAEIIKQLSAPDANKRAEALAAAGYHHMNGLYDKVLEAALRGKGEERNAAIYGLGWYERAVPEAALRQLLSDKDLQIRYGALELATRKDPARFAREAMDITRAMMSQQSDGSQGYDEQRQLSYLAQILSRLARVAIPSEVLNGLKDSNPVMRRTVVLSLQLAGDPDAIPHLQPLQGDPDAATREAAKAALVRLGPADQ